MKMDSSQLYRSWRGKLDYGIVFTTVFIAVQKNIAIFMVQILSSYQ